MATSEEVHKQESKVNYETMCTEEDMHNVYKNEHILNNKRETIESRIKALIVTWGELNALSSPSKENLRTLTEFLKSHTLNIVLSSTWQKYKEKYCDHLINAILMCSEKFQSFKGFQSLCNKLVNITNKPWENEMIIRMLNCEDPITQPEDYNFFVHQESGYFISMRLKKLCEDKCEDMALNLTRAYIKCCEWADNHSKSMYISEDQKKFVFDVYLALLYKLNCTSEMSNLLKNVTLHEGIDMVRRFAYKMVSASKIWVNSVRIAQLSGTIFLTRGVMLQYEEGQGYLNELLDIWLPTYQESDMEELIGCLRRIVKNALTAPHMYLICNKLTNRFGSKMRTYNIEIYIQALNTDLNLLENLKTDNEAEKVKQLEQRVSDGLINLSVLLSDNLNVSRECVLSAFSIKPTEKLFQKIEEVARASGYEVLDTGQWKCKFHPPAQKEDEVLTLCNTCGDYMPELQISPALKQPNTALTEALHTNNMGLSEQIIDDLVVIIFCARYQLLSWLQNWKDLQRLCLMYLNDPVQTKNLITELKFLEIDYTPFLSKREFEKENGDSSAEQEIWDEDSNRKKKRRRLNSSSEEEDDDYDQMYTPNIHRSDPEVLKTLRNFRRSLKKDIRYTPQQPTKPSWYNMYPSPIDYSQPTSSAHLPFMQSSLPIPLPIHNPTISGLQIRKDIYHTPQEQLNALQFFRTGHNLAYIMNEQMINENFSKSPVIQGYESASSKVAKSKNTEPMNLMVPKQDRRLIYLGNGEDTNKRLIKKNKEKHDKQRADSIERNRAELNLIGRKIFENFVQNDKRTQQQKKEQLLDSIRKLNAEHSVQKTCIIEKIINQPSLVIEKVPGPAYNQPPIAHQNVSHTSHQSAPGPSTPFNNPLPAHQNLLGSLMPNSNPSLLIKKVSIPPAATNTAHHELDFGKPSTSSLIITKITPKLAATPVPSPNSEQSTSLSLENFKNSSKESLGLPSKSFLERPNPTDASTISIQLPLELGKIISNRTQLEQKSDPSNQSVPLNELPSDFGKLSRPTMSQNQSLLDLEMKSDLSEFNKSLLTSEPSLVSIQLPKELQNIPGTTIASNQFPLDFQKKSESIAISNQSSSALQIIPLSPSEVHGSNESSEMSNQSSILQNGTSSAQNETQVESTNLFNQLLEVFHYELEAAKNSNEPVLKQKESDSQLSIQNCRKYNESRDETQLTSEISNPSVKPLFLKLLNRVPPTDQMSTEPDSFMKISEKSLEENIFRREFLAENFAILEKHVGKKELEEMSMEVELSEKEKFIMEFVQGNLGSKIEENNMGLINKSELKFIEISQGNYMEAVQECKESVQNFKETITILKDGMVQEERESIEGIAPILESVPLVHENFPETPPILKEVFPQVSEKISEITCVNLKGEMSTVDILPENTAQVEKNITQAVLEDNLLKTTPVLEEKMEEDEEILGITAKQLSLNEVAVEKFSKAKDITTPVDSKTVDSDNEEVSSQDIIINYKKFNLKECRVNLKGMQEPVLRHMNKLKNSKYKEKKKVGRLRGRPRKVDNKITSPSENVQSSVIRDKDENYNSQFNFPLQSKNQRAVLSTNNSILEEIKKKLLVTSDKMNPRVVLKRLEESCIKSLLARVPGISDTQLFRPENTDQIVNVVQVAGGRATSTVQAPNTQTSTQVSPHIQRIGQPRNDKTEQSTNPETTSPSNTKTSTNTCTITKPVATQSSTLINILSQQIIRPSPSNNTRTKGGGPLINILSQQTIKPANPTTVAKTTTTTVTTESQGNNTSRVIATSSEQQQIINQIVNPNRATTGPIKAVVGTSTSEQGRIVQFICKSTDGKLIPVTSFPSNRLVKVGTTQAVTSTLESPTVEENLTKAIPNKKTESNEISETLPKFQQAFGKSVYQNNVDSTNSTNITNNAGADVDKSKTQIKNSTVSVQPIQGGVIYTRQMPVGQTINLIPQTRGQVFRIATTNTEQISLVKETVIHSKMSALLAAALQGKPKNSESVISSSETDINICDNNTTTTTTARIQLTRPTLVQSARIVKPVLQIPSNVIRNTPQTNLSSTTLEQLREFDMVYKQVKERSSTSTSTETSSITESSSDTSPQCISVTYLNQGQKLNCAPVVVVSSYNNLQQAASPALSVASQGSSSPCVTPAPTPTPVLPKVSAKSSKGKSVKNAPMHTSKTSPIPKPQQKPQEDEHTTQRIFDILAEYAEQLRNSPDLNNKPAPRRRSNPPTNPNQNSKRKKSSSLKKSGQCSSLSTEADLDDPRTVGSEDSSCGVVQISMQEDEQTPTVASTSESNDSSTVNNTRQQLILTDSSHNQTRNLIIADSSVGEALKIPNTAVLVPGNYIMPVSMVKGGQQIAVVSGGSKILATVPARSGPNMLLFQSFLNQNRKSNVPTVKYSTIQPISGISSQTLTGVSAQPPVILPPPSHGISTVTLGQPIAIKKIDDSDRINTELLLTISQSRENNCTTTEDTSQPDSSTNVVPKLENVDLDENTAMSDNSSEKTFSYHKPLITPITTPVIAQAIKEELSNEQTESSTTQTIMTLNINPLDTKGENMKAEERVQSVLVTAGSSNGPMLSHSPPQYKQSNSGSNQDQTKDDYLRNGGKRDEKAQQTCVLTMQGRLRKPSYGRMEKEVQQICMQRRQAAIERELRLQKSLSEECEDLGVDEPSTSDLFPEALLFDSNNSPSFDQTSHDLLKRTSQAQDKEENKLTLFSDDDFMFETSEYQGANQLCYEEVVDTRILTNGQNSTCEDHTLLQTCTSMSDVTLSSPISPENYHASTPPPLNKYMHKYTNKKKSERLKQVDWPAEVSSSEDTTGSNELNKCVNSPEVCMNKRSDEELSDGSFKVVRLSITKKECSEVHCSDDTDSLSGRGARKSVKKMCSCCNGSEDSNVSRKRPSSHQHTANPHKKAFPNKKR